MAGTPKSGRAPTAAPSASASPTQAARGGLFDGIEAVFFDLFDTLIRIDEASLPSLSIRGQERRTTVPIVHREVVADHGIEIERFSDVLVEAWQEVEKQRSVGWAEVSARVRARLMVERLGLGASSAEREAFVGRITETHGRALADAARPARGARALLERVHERGLPVVLISNFDFAPAADWILAQAELDDLVTTRVISETLGVRKPHEKIFHAALEHVGLEPTACLHVGDQPLADAWGAGRLGMRTVWINRTGDPYDEPEHAPTLEVDEIDALLEHL